MISQYILTLLKWFLAIIAIISLFVLTLLLSENLIDGIRWFIALIGIMVILISTMQAFYNYILFFKDENVKTINLVRLKLGYGIILGLEFMVGADIIESVAKPTFYDIGMLGALVLIRTLLSYFLNKELENVLKAEKNSNL